MTTENQAPEGAELSDPEIHAAVCAAVKTGSLSWLGYKKDEDGKYTVPLMSLYDYQLARVAIAADRPQRAAPAPQAAQQNPRVWVTKRDQHNYDDREEWIVWVDRKPIETIRTLKIFRDPVVVPVEMDDGLTAAYMAGQFAERKKSQAAPAPQSAPVALTDDQLKRLGDDIFRGAGQCDDWALARAAIAEFCRLNGIPEPQTKEPTNDR